MHSFILALGTLRAPVLVALLALAVILLPSQTHEIFEAIQEAEGLIFLLEYARAAAFISIFALVVALSSLWLLRTATPYRCSAVSSHRAFLESLALALPLVIFLSVVIANLDRVELAESPKLVANNELAARFVTWWRIAIGAAFGIAGAAVFLLHRNEDFRQRLVEVAMKGSGFISRFSVWHGLIAVATTIGFSIAVVMCLPGAFAKIFGPIGVLFFFVSVLCIATSLLGYIYDRYQVPAIAGLVTAAIVWAYVPTNDNHRIQLVPEKVANTVDAPEAFVDWLSKRPDRDDYKGRPYPVYIVTAEGGGLYAAIHAAWVLARIQDNCPAFASHVFAISSVSGGSLGAALFAAMVNAYPPKRLPAAEKCPLKTVAPGPLQATVESFFADDFLTPLLSAGLFPDFFQRFWFWPIEKFDRSRALERSIDAAWKRVSPIDNSSAGAIFNQSSRRLWSIGGESPALLINATLVHNGERVIIAPFQLMSKHVVFADRYVDLLNDTDSTSLATAVGISSRFPLIAPPALHWDDRLKMAAQMVDGGYYENSGVFTAINLIDLLRLGTMVDPSKLDTVPAVDVGSCTPNNTLRTRDSAGEIRFACVKLITIRAKLLEQKDFLGGDVLSTIAAMYQTRTARGVANLRLSSIWYCGGSDCGAGKAATNPHLYVHLLDTVQLRLALGWYLSKCSVAAIMGKRRVGCKSIQAGDRMLTARERAAVEENEAVYLRIAQDINLR